MALITIDMSRHSVSGISLDFLFLNVFGFACYSIYTVAFLTSRSLNQDYDSRHLRSTAGAAVRANDAFFALHALVISGFTIAQVYVLGYERAEGQRISWFGRGMLSGSFTSIIILLVLTRCGSIDWLDVVMGLSYIKLLISFVKFLPQLWLNYKRQSTVGWHIANNLLDLLGGILSLSRNFTVSRRLSRIAHRDRATD